MSIFKGVPPVLGESRCFPSAPIGVERADNCAIFASDVLLRRDGRGSSYERPNITNRRFLIIFV